MEQTCNEVPEVAQERELSVFPGLLQALVSRSLCWLPASPLHGSRWEQGKVWKESWQHGPLPAGCGLEDLKGRGAQELTEVFFSVEPVFTAKLPMHLLFLPWRRSFFLTNQRCDAASVHIGKEDSHLKALILLLWWGRLRKQVEEMSPRLVSCQRVGVEAGGKQVLLCCCEYPQ